MKVESTGHGDFSLLSGVTSLSTLPVLDIAKDSLRAPPASAPTDGEVCREVKQSQQDQNHSLQPTYDVSATHVNSNEDHQRLYLLRQKYSIGHMMDWIR